MYYCEGEKDLNTTNDYVFCRTGIFKTAAEAVREA